ncbi:MAG: hypothetical protein IPK28_11540 [Devosia sp.]|nr:hypothetical protein [Devosia sp.]
MACRPARRLAASLLLLLAGLAPVPGQEAIPASAEDGLRVHVAFRSFERLGERCGIETGDVAGHADASFEWVARNDYARHLADVVLDYHAVVPEAADIDAAAEAEFAATLAGTTSTLAELCAFFLGGVYDGRFDLTELDAPLWDRLLASDRMITEARRAP